MNPKDLIRYMAMALVDKPAEVEVNVIEGTQRSIIELEVAKEDVGKIIGKRGRTADAIRTILQSVSAKHRRHMTLEIIDYGKRD